jgi:hypothetical protein
MDRKEIKKVVKNMIEVSHRQNARLEVSKGSNYTTDFVDNVYNVEVLNTPSDVKLINGKWHQANGYNIEMNKDIPCKENSSKEEVNISEYRVINENNEKSLVRIKIKL